jgi:hypothetical protein
LVDTAVRAVDRLTWVFAGALIICFAFTKQESDEESSDDERETGLAVYLGTYYLANLVA